MFLGARFDTPQLFLIYKVEYKELSSNSDILVPKKELKISPTENIGVLITALSVLPHCSSISSHIRTRTLYNHVS